ncbi:hypothetical protein [Streptomyces nitrosporeus]|uniref:Uncharacterized protein n=1 Tax=Streptomyces nitrosporeus TaxID=28894 RepID=A0A5J6FDH8_9ACTN|nr:hypothetical protein [Streptomyces nitrosporeus]QEU74639.1 hypothetical protein CP967_23950 [Streptomyces nitrosporeus]GGY84711.1 hypothetical protein GCM10010327_13830 [Streptomyces nitrosporeus]
MRSLVYDVQFRERAARTRAWGVVLLSLAALLWVWCAVLVLMPYEVDREPGDEYPAECESRLFTDGGTANEGLLRHSYCENERDWPEVVALLGLSVPVSTVGAGLFTIGTVSRRMSAHSQAMRELDAVADRREQS